MKINKFKLIDQGRKGIIIDATEFIASEDGKFKAIDNVVRTRQIPISPSLLKNIQGLKYYFLHLTGHWVAPYNKYFDKNTMKIISVAEDQEMAPAHGMLNVLWQKTLVTGASYKGSGFVLTGTIETVENKFMGLATPHITVEDDFGFFTECMEVLDNIANEISKEIGNVGLALDMARNTLAPEELQGKTEKEIMEMFIEYAQERGMVMMIQDPNERENADKIENTEIHQSGTIEHAPEANEDLVREGDDDGEPQTDAIHSGSEDAERVGPGNEELPEGENSPMGTGAGIEEDELPWDESKDKVDKSKGYAPKPAAVIGADLESPIPKPADDSPTIIAGPDIENAEYSEAMGIEVASEEENNEEDW